MTTGLVWLRADLRIADNPAFAEALQTCDTVRALYVVETDKALRPMGAAARAWLAISLDRLAAALAEYGVPLDVVEGESAVIVPERVRAAKAGRVYWNRRYSPAEREHDAAIKTRLEASDTTVTSYNASLLFEPWTVKTKAGGSYGVYTPFWRELRSRDIPPAHRAPQRRDAITPKPITAFGRQPKWATKILAHWEPGEDAARKVLHRFLDDRLADYRNGRDIPGVDHTSQLSPYLRHGEIGPRQIWAAVAHAVADDPHLDANGEKFLAELGWREFSYHLLYHREDIARVAMQEKFSGLGWRTDDAALDAWTSGRTGIPIVDAGMRQLWETGWMHNRVRMIVASLLSKNLLIDWRLGEDWFWDTLVDADVANNPASWQWVAGSGADAAPYFRIFNPVTQGERFDGEGTYVRRWVPELADLPDSALQAPFKAKPDVLKAAGIVLGDTYPEPIVDLATSRERALAAFKAL